MSRELRDYQRDASAAVREEWAAGNTATAVVLPTGTGKTDVIADLGTSHAADGGWVLALAHRDELLNQITDRFGMHGATRVGRIQGARTERQHRLTVASTPTMAARVAKLAEATGVAERRRAEHRLPRRPSMVLYDEALALTTPVPTPTGWTTVGALRPGDLVIGASGRPVRVRRKTTVETDATCYRVAFHGGDSMTASAGHRWLVDRPERTGWRPRVLTTEEVIGLGGAARVPTAAPWELGDAEPTPVPAYLLGLWLGDGSTGQFHVTGDRDDLEFYAERLARIGVGTHMIRPPGGTATAGRMSFGADPIRQTFRTLPCWQDKHIPAAFLRASRHDREELLRGLMDTDGHVSALVGQCTFTGTERLVDQVRELLATLGQRAGSPRRVDDARGAYWRITWTPQHGVMPVALPRKVERVGAIVDKGRWRSIRSITPVPSVPVQCIEVESDDHLFLAGRDGIVTHNCHHAPSPSSMAVLRWAGVLDGSTPAAGFTATLVRGDRRGLGDVWQSVAFKRDIAWAIDEGFLVRPRGRVVVASHMDLNTAKVTAGDYQDNQLGEMVSQDADEIVKAWREHARTDITRDGTTGQHRRTIVFAPTVAAAQVLCDEFTAQGVDAACVFGSTPHAERQRIYGDLSAGRTTVLCSVMVTTEGWDCPPVECVLMARPTKLAGLYQQCIGRALRPSPDTGKTDCLVLDVVGASRTQRLTTLIDLSPTAEYDASEIDALPCEVCGLPTQQTRPGELTCACLAEPGERDPDGGRRRLVGPAQYEDLDLLMESSKAVWLQTYGGTPMLPAGDRTAILWHDKGTDLYRAGHMANRGTMDGQWLTETSEGMVTAMQRAEAWAIAYAPMTAKRSASWRRSGAASERQVDMALGLGITGAEQMDKARLSDEISVALTSQRLRR